MHWWQLSSICVYLQQTRTNIWQKQIQEDSLNIVFICHRVYLVHFWVLPWTWSSIPKKALAPALAPAVTPTRCFIVKSHGQECRNPSSRTLSASRSWNTIIKLIYFSKSFCSFESECKKLNSNYDDGDDSATMMMHTFFQVGIRTDTLVWYYVILIGLKTLTKACMYTVT